MFDYISFSDHTRLSVWVLDGDPKHAELLEFAVNADNLEHTLVLLTVSMTAPWGIMDQLHTWASTLQDHIDKINLDPDKFKDRQDKSKLLEIGFLCVFAFTCNPEG